MSDLFSRLVDHETAAEMMGICPNKLGTALIEIDPPVPGVKAMGNENYYDKEQLYEIERAVKAHINKIKKPNLPVAPEVSEKLDSVDIKIVSGFDMIQSLLLKVHSILKSNQEVKPDKGTGPSSELLNAINMLSNRVVDISHDVSEIKRVSKRTETKVHTFIKTFIAAQVPEDQQHHYFKLLRTMGHDTPADAKLDFTVKGGPSKANDYEILQRNGL